MKDDIGVLITLNDGQNGYDVVGNYIKRYWKHYNYEATVAIHLDVSYDGREYRSVYDTATPYHYDDMMFDYDWWEGEQYIRLKGIKYLQELNIEGGIYTE